MRTELLNKQDRYYEKDRISGNVKNIQSDIDELFETIDRLECERDLYKVRYLNQFELVNKLVKNLNSVERVDEDFVKLDGKIL